MNYVVFDLEWNNSYKAKGLRFNYKCPNEIIQMGAVKIDGFHLTESYDADIRPMLYKRINPRIVALTGIKSKGMMSRTHFNQAYKEFKEWCGESPILCSWSCNDIIELKRNAKYFCQDNKFNWYKRYIDIQKLFETCYELNQSPSLLSAVKRINLPVIESNHNALFDAKLAGWIFLHLKNNFDVDKMIKENRVKSISFSGNMGKIDKRKLRVKCPKCGRFVKTETHKITKDQYWAFGNCKKCDIKIRHKTRLKIKGKNFVYSSWNKIEDTEEVEDSGR